MEGFETEEQQLEAIKKWWEQNGTAVIVGAILGIGAVIGYINWKGYKEDRREAASEAYQLIVEENTDDNNIDVAKAEKLIADYADTPYSIMLALQLAKQAVESNDLTTAEKHLRDVLARAEEGGVQHVARLRLGRVLLAADKPEEALSLISNLEQGAFKSSYGFLKGMIYINQGDTEKAKAAFKDAESSISGMPEHPNLRYVREELETDITDLVEIDV
ncbi:MAG: tetratricopeptide repeat protein [Pseudomonadota bacterium]